MAPVIPADGPLATLHVPAAYVCIRKQRGSTPEPTLETCNLYRSKPLLPCSGFSTVSIAGIAGNVNSFPSWTALGVVAAIPPLVMMWRWNDPLPTMSEAIQEARR